VVTYETVRQLCLKFGQRFAKAIRRQQTKLSDTWFTDEVFISIGSMGATIN
jgi:putative transposase